MEILRKIESPDETGSAQGTQRVLRGDAGAFHFERPRLNELFSRAVKCPVVVVCAGTGYGKTSAMQDFVRKSRTETVWVQLYEGDRVAARLWENFTRAMNGVSEAFHKAIVRLGFPDSVDKINRYISLMESLVPLRRRIVVIDDFHFVEDPAMIRFGERTLRNLPVGTTVVLLTRAAPGVNIADMVSAGDVFVISEDDLRFTEDEVSSYLEKLGARLNPEHARGMMLDTEGWAFALNLVARSSANTSGYTRCMGKAMRASIFQLMESEVWDVVSEPLRRFLLCLSLVNHLPADLVALIAASVPDASAGELLGELGRQNAYVRKDGYAGVYVIHPLFHEFLAAKQALLDEGARRETYAIAARWCQEHGFRVDALSYFESMGDYDSIAKMLYMMPVQIPEEIALYLATILDRAPSEAFETVDLLAVLHVRSYICLGMWAKSAELVEVYEAKLIALPTDTEMKCRTLSRLYYNMSFLRSLLCTTDDRYDFDLYIGKYRKCLESCSAVAMVDPGKLPAFSPTAWLNRAGSARAGSVDEYVEAFARMSALLEGCPRGTREAECELARCELKFYRGDVKGAEFFLYRAQSIALKYGQFGVIHVALLYALRISLVQGNYEKALQTIAGIKELLEQGEYVDRFMVHDICMAWYCCALGLPQRVPAWLRKDFSPYGHAGFIENFGNQMKARFHYATANYAPLLSYIREMCERESFLFGRVEMLAMKACAHYRMKEKPAAFATLEEAYAAAAPNEIVMPFAELGKDMRTLTTAVLKVPDAERKIPRDWLETVNRRAASYAKRQAHIISLYREDNDMDDVVLSSRESEVLGDLSQGLSRAEIATVRGLSINTVKMVIGNIHAKLGTENLADLIRIAVERKLIRVKR